VKLTVTLTTFSFYLQKHKINHA